MKLGICRILMAIYLLVPVNIHSQVISQRDVDNFWVMYDSVSTISDSSTQVRLVEALYLSKGTIGLKELQKMRGWTADKFRLSINAHPAFWKTVRFKTTALAEPITEIKDLYKRYHEVYNDFKEPEIYFMIGYIETGGTTTQHQVLIGTEVLTADSSVDASGLHPMLQNFFLSGKTVAGLIAHELTHTQQARGDMETRRKSNLLGFSIAEGACDFVAEFITGKALLNPYLVYGRQHDREIWDRFKKEMHGSQVHNWLYNGGYNDIKNADLGYYVGYAICKSYYQHSSDKKQAVKDIITLDLENIPALDTFLKVSGYDDGFPRD